MRKATVEWEEEKDKENRANTVFLSWLHNRLFLILTVSSRKTLPIAPKKTGITAGDVLAKAYWPSGLRTVVMLFAFMEQVIGEKEGW